MSINSTLSAKKSFPNSDEVTNELITTSSNDKISEKKVCPQHIYGSVMNDSYNGHREDKLDLIWSNHILRLKNRGAQT